MLDWMVGNRGGPAPATEGVVNTNTHAHTQTQTDKHTDTHWQKRERECEQKRDRQKIWANTGGLAHHDSASKFKFWKLKWYPLFSHKLDNRTTENTSSAYII